MASIYRKPGSKTYMAKFYLPGEDEKPRMIRKTTGQTARAKALAVAVELERAAKGTIAAENDTALQAKAILARAVTDIEQGKFNPTLARKYLSELLVTATKRELEFYSVEKWMAEWLARKRKTTSPATMKRYELSVRRFLAFIGPERIGKPLESIQAADVRGFRDELREKGLSGKSVNKFLKDINAAFRLAIDEEVIVANPAVRVEKLDLADSFERKPFTIEEVRAMVAAAPSDEWKILITLGAYAGMRLGDASRLRWESVDFVNRILVFMPTKTSRKRKIMKVDIHQSLLAMLESAPISDEPEAFVLPTLAKTPLNTRTGLSCFFTDTIMRAAGVDRGKPSRAAAKQGEPPAKKGMGRVNYERGFHSLRHTFVTEIQKHGADNRTSRALAGHDDESVHAGYSHSDRESCRRAIDSLPAL